MKIISEISYISTERTVIKATAIEVDLEIANSFGEAKNIEEAEDRAIKRLINKLNATSNMASINKINNFNQELGNASQNHEIKEAISSIDLPKNFSEKSSTEINKKTIGSINDLPAAYPTQVPEDWSNELSDIDIELKRLGWSKEDENNFLSHILNHKSRNKITEYSQLLFYISILKSLSKDLEVEKVDYNEIRIKEIHKGDKLLKVLNWDLEKGRQFLREKMGVDTRQKLDNYSLFMFNTKLEEYLKSNT